MSTWNVLAAEAGENPETGTVVPAGGATTVARPGDAPPLVTSVPDRSGPRPAPPARRRLRVVRGSDVLALVGAAAAALSISAVLFTQLGPFTGLLGYVVTSWLLFVGIYAILVSFDENGPTVKDRIASVTVHSLALVLLIALVFTIVFTVTRGWQALVHLNFYSQDMTRAGPLDPITVGGITHAILGTLIQVGITLAIAVPLGLLGAVFLHQVPGPFSRFVRTVVEAMTALPDVLAGLFIYATLILTFGVDLSGIAASAALAITILPIIVRAGDVVLRLVPGGLTEAAYALGAGQWNNVRFILLPTARSGLATAVILGAARAIGETSPVLLTSGVTATVNVDPFHGSMVSLPLETFIDVQTGIAAMIERGFGTATILLVLVVGLFAIARAIGGRGPGQLSARQRRRRVLASRRDAARFSTTQPPKEVTPSPNLGEALS